MSDRKKTRNGSDEGPSIVGRRGFIGGSIKTAGVAGVVGAGGGATVAGLAPGMVTKAAHAQEPGGGAHVGPGQLDEYYGFWSSGQTGDTAVTGATAHTGRGETGDSTIVVLPTFMAIRAWIWLVPS